MPKKAPNWKLRLSYNFDNFMSKGGLSVFLALLVLFATAFLLMAGIRFAVNLAAPESDFSPFDQMWRVFLQISDAGAVAEDGEANLWHKAVGIVTVFLGLVLFSSLVAFITSQFEAKLDELRKGRSLVMEDGHSLILGFGDRVLEIIRELIIANESERRAAIVVLSELEKDAMDDFFRDRIEDSKTTRIITRSGNTSSVHMLERVSLQRAKSVIILNTAANDATDAEKRLADARVLKTIMAVLSCTGEDKVPNLVAELHLPNSRKLARSISERIFIIEETDVLAKLIVQTSRTTGLAQVYDRLVGFDGCEFYFYKAPAGWGKRSYGELQLHFPACSLLGYRTSDGTICLNPPGDRIFEDSWQALLLAEDDSLILWSETATRAEQQIPAIPRDTTKRVEKQLILGWSETGQRILEEYCDYLVEGSTLDVVHDRLDDAMQERFDQIRQRHPGISMSLSHTDIHEAGCLAALHPEQYDNVIILQADGGEAELRDSQTIATLLELRQYFRSLRAPDLRTQLITEVADSDNIDVIRTVGVHDFLISNKFVSRLYAQVSEDPAVLKVYEDLFSAAGSEIYLKPLSRYWRSFPADLSFAELCAAAGARAETCFGLRMQAGSGDPGQNYGIIINPDKNQRFVLNRDDQLLVLAEDET